MGYSTLGDAIPRLANLTLSPRGHSGPSLGGQNFTHCCLIAMNESLNVNGPNQSLAFNHPSYFLPHLTISQLESAVSGSSFPCGATWTGDPAGAPTVRVPFNWCTSQCGGWEMSHFNVMSQW